MLSRLLADGNCAPGTWQGPGGVCEHFGVVALRAGLGPTELAGTLVGAFVMCAAAATAASVWSWLLERRVCWSQLLRRLWPVAAFYWVYEVLSVISQNPGRVEVSEYHAFGLVGLERNLGVWVEPWLSRHPIPFATHYYEWAQLVVTVVVVGYVVGAEGESFFRVARDSLAVVVLVGLVVFWLYPVAPPRLLPASFGVPFSGLGFLSSGSDQFAAMPSLHTAFAGWAACVVWSVRPRSWLSKVATLNVVLTGVVVLTTGNHYWLDVVAGEVLALSAAWFASRVERVRQSRLGGALCSSTLLPMG